MKNNLKFNNSEIFYTFSSVNGKYIVELTYEFINQYQLQNTSIKISSKSNNAISSIDIRKLNIYSLNKKAQKQISLDQAWSGSSFDCECKLVAWHSMKH